MRNVRKFKLLDGSSVVLDEAGVVIYSEHKKSLLGIKVGQLAYEDSSYWQEIFQDTLESLTDQIKELAKKQGMKCEVVLEKKKEVDVFDFCAIYNQNDGITDLSVKIKNSSLPNVEAKQNEIIQAIKTILEND